jgi:hypothetical protein
VNTEPSGLPKDLSLGERLAKLREGLQDGDAVLRAAVGGLEVQMAAAFFSLGTTRVALRVPEDGVKVSPVLYWDQSRLPESPAILVLCRGMEKSIPLKKAPLDLLLRCSPHLGKLVTRVEEVSHLNLIKVTRQVEDIHTLTDRVREVSRREKVPVTGSNP